MKNSRKEIFAQQWYMTKLCFRAAPGSMAFHLFESVKLQISIFMESTWCMNYMLEVVEAGGTWQQVLRIMALLMGMIAVSTVTFSIYSQSVLPKLKMTLYHSFRTQIYEKARQLDLACYDDKNFYQQFILATQEADACIDRYLDTLGAYAGQLVFFFLTAWFCLKINPVILAIILLLLPLELYVMKKENTAVVNARMERVAPEQKREYESRVFYLSDYARELRMNPLMYEKYRNDFKDSNREIQNINEKHSRKIFLYGALRHAFLEDMCGKGIVLTVLLYQTLAACSLSYAHMVTSITCANRMLHNTASMLSNWKMLAENSAYIAKIRELLSIETTILSEAALPVPENPRELSVEHLDFSYVPERPVLKDINLLIRPGQKIALVGYNGSGKTTLVKLLLRLYDPVKGCIRLGDTDIRDFDVQQYRFSIGSVFQDFKLYAASVKENVLMDVASGTKEETFAVEEALYHARFTLRDRRLVYQIETPLTTEFEKDGVNLSGGEAQKIAIARTLYRKQNLIIMDEPSSSLDPLSEYLLNQELHEIARDKTVIFISHRLSTTRDADCIYMMEQGRIIESGTHEELLAQSGKYAEMWNVQAGLYQEEAGA